MDGPDLKPDIRKALEAKTRELGLVAARGAGRARRPGPEPARHDRRHHEELARTVALPARGPGIFGPEVRSILLSLSDSQKKRYLDPVLRGEKATAFAQTEPDAGADPGGMRTTAVRRGRSLPASTATSDSSRTPRAPTFCSWWPSTDPKKGSRGGLTVFLVDMDTPGVSIAGQTVHMMGDVTYEIALDNVKVPVENRIGNEGDGMKAAQTWINANRVQPGRARTWCRGRAASR